MAARRHVFFRNAVVLLGPVTCQAKPTGTLALLSGAVAPFANPLQGKLDGIRHWRMLLRVHFIETPVFTRQITALLDDGDYRQLQVTLALKPAAGCERFAGWFADEAKAAESGSFTIWWTKGKSTFSLPMRKTNRRISIAASYGFSATW